MSVTDQLRQVIIDSGMTNYRLNKETGVGTRVLDRFVSGQTSGMRGHNIDRLCDYFGLELRSAKNRETAGKESRKKRTAGSRSRKKPKR